MKRLSFGPEGLTKSSLTYRCALPRYYNTASGRHSWLKYNNPNVYAEAHPLAPMFSWDQLCCGLWRFSLKVINNNEVQVCFSPQLKKREIKYAGNNNGLCFHCLAVAVRVGGVSVVAPTARVGIATELISRRP